MSHAATVERIRRHPRFAELVGRRARLSWTLVVLTLAAYFGLAVLVAFRPGLLRQPLGEGALTNVGIVHATAVILVGWVLTWLYVRRTNGAFDDINNDILEEATK
ncbi:DUF485 domain-containing protein [Variovorax sp. J22R133]|uniref:DUF485 domain-containing protein n=1 Tax=Variovorax brevis TaxID=3053503 RepID=UPI002576DD22|nr:DUF485 domain-containing protein [Variovorax sp. J22R133]MDM0117450.1 DUF485 domain-containing protein [Variovorax sp. J22R133]